MTSRSAADVAGVVPDARAQRACRIACVGDFALGSRRAHAINVVKTSGGFGRLGWEVLLLCREPEGGAGSIREALSAYGEPGLRVETIADVDERTHPPGSDKRCGPMASWAVERARAFGAEVMYARLMHAAVAWADAGGVAIAETHAHVGEAKPGFVRLLEATARRERPVAAISTISRVLWEHYVARGASAERVHVVPDGVDVELFGRPASWGTRGGSQRTAERPLAVYAGHLYDYKGIPTILEAARLMPGVEFELIGGLPADIDRVRGVVAGRGLDNVRVVGWIDHAALPPYLWRADVLLLPPGLGDPSKDWTSPVKLGEYLAAGAPIVASAIPALLDLVDARVVEWFEPDDAGSMVGAIGRAVSETPEQAGQRRLDAMAMARGWSYAERAGAMLRAAGVGVRTPLPLAP